MAGTALTGQTKASTYDSLLKITDNGPVGGTEKVVTDGMGNDTALKVGTGGVTSTGTLQADGDVGSGTTTPTFAAGSGMEISRNGTATLRLENTTSGQETSLEVQAVENDAVYYRSYNSRPHKFGDGATVWAQVTSTGINSAAIGATTPAAGAFTTLTASSTATLDTLASSGATITGGTVNNAIIGGSTPAAGTFTALSAPFVKQSGGNVRVTSTFDKSADTSTSNVTGLSVSLAAGETYSFDAALFCSQTSTGGYVVGVGGTATTANIYGAIVYHYGFGSVQNDVINTLPGGSALGGAGTAYQVTVKGTITVINAGTFTITFAQASANGASSVKRGSYLHVTQY